jgi:hypothetical protein
MDLVSTTILLDRERTLKFTYESLDKLSDLPLARRGNRSPIELWQAANGLDVRAMSMMIWAGCLHERDGGFTLERAQSALKSALSGGRITYRELNAALNAALNQSGMLGLFDRDLDEAADPTMSPPVPTPTTASRPGAGESPSA